MGIFSGSDGKQSRMRGAIGLTSAFAVAMALATTPLTASVFAAPADQAGPTETFTGTVVPCTEYMVNGVTRYNVERQSKTQAGQLEQLTVETPGSPSTIKGYEIVQVTGNYNTSDKIFRTTSVASVGQMNTGSFPGCTQRTIDDRNDNGNNDNGNNDNDSNDNDSKDNGSNDNDSKDNDSNDNGSNDNK